MSNPNEQKAAAIKSLRSVPLPTYAYYGLGSVPTYDSVFYEKQWAALSAAGLIVTPRHEEALSAWRELSPRFTSGLVQALASPSSLLGQRVGLRSDFVTPLHERALRDAEALHRDGAFSINTTILQSLRDIGRESLALKQPAGWYADGSCVRYRPARPELDAIVCPDSLTAERVAKAMNAQEGK